MEKIEKEWERTSARMAEIRKNGGFSVLAEKHQSEVKEMTSHTGDCVFCMDGRVAPKENGVAVAGSGLLLKDDDEAKEFFVSELRSRGVKKVFLHEDCGAVGLYAKIKNISLEQAEKDAQQWAEELTELLGGNEKPKKLPVALDFHNEQLVYITFTNNFCIKNAPDFPTGFQVDANVVSFENVLAQVKVAINIACGSHGFCERFTKDSPFTIVFVTKDKNELSEMKRNKDVSSLVSEMDGRVVVDGFALT